MKKALKIIAIVLLSFTLYITIDCIRLRNAEIGTKPFITVSMAEYENGNKYIGLGYSIKYYKDRQKLIDGGIEKIVERGYGAEFRLFDRILIWAWIE